MNVPLHHGFYRASLGALSITPPFKGTFRKHVDLQSHQVVVLGVVRTLSLRLELKNTVPLRCHNLTTVQRWNFKPTEILKPPKKLGGGFDVIDTNQEPR